MRRPSLTGAYGVPSPPPTPAMVAHPERVARYTRWMMLMWVARLAVLGLLLVLVLYATHVI